MVSITREYLKNIATNNTTYLRGERYYLQNRVDIIDIDERYSKFTAQVFGTSDYIVNIVLDENGYMDEAECNCPAFSEYWGCCKHIIAALLKIAEIYRKYKYETVRAERYAQTIFDYFEYQESMEKLTINLELNYECVINKYNRFNVGFLSMRIGENKLYVVKSIEKLIESIINNQILYFGKEFTFDPNIHCFSEQDKRVIDLLIDIYDNEQTLRGMSHSRIISSLFSGKKAYLPQNSIKKLFEIVKDRRINTIINETKHSDIEVVEEDIAINFSLVKERNNLNLEVSFEDNIIPLVEDGEYFFVNDKIHKISKSQRKNLMPFYNIVTNQGSNVIRIPQKYDERFISEVYPVIEKLGKVEIDKNVEASIYNTELKTEIFLDKVENIITADIKFVYGEYKLDAFSNEEGIRKDDRILLRDISKEKEILRFFETADFKINKNYVYLDDEDKIFNLVYNKLPILQKIADVFYSERFRSLKIKDTTSFTGGVRTYTTNNLLEFSFSIDGINDSELRDVFNSIKEKKKYYKLADGSYLPLDNDELNDISKLVDYLDLDSQDFENGKIDIPKYKALFIDEHLKGSNINSIKRNLQFKELVQNIREPEDIDYEIPSDLDNVLREYQKFGFKWLKTLSSYGFGGILADDMGLGKTIQILSFLVSEKKEKGSCPSLIVAPTSLVYNWQSEIEKFSPSLKTLIIAGKKEERRDLSNSIDAYDIVITSYPLIRRDIDLYKDIFFRLCVLDEAQHIKNPMSQNAKSVKEIKANNYFALTGTPIENSLTELWSIFDFIMPGYLYNHRKFVNKFERPIVKNKNDIVMNELIKHIKHFMLRRVKRDVLKELPEKIDNKIVAELTEEQKKIYLAYLEKIKGEIEEEINNKGFARSHIKILSGLTRLRQICCHPSMFIEDYNGKSGKLLLLEELINEALESGHRILLFSQFTSMLSIIKSILDERNIQYKYLDGSTDMKERGTLVKEFNEGNGDIFLISLKAGGTGLNLTGADTVIHFDPWWNPAVEEQATDRAHRIGQKKSVHVMKLITKGTIEEKIFELQARKKKLIESIIKPGEELVSKLSEEEIRSLFDMK